MPPVSLLCGDYAEVKVSLVQSSSFYFRVLLYNYLNVMYKLYNVNREMLPRYYCYPNLTRYHSTREQGLFYEESQRMFMVSRI